MIDKHPTSFVVLVFFCWHDAMHHSSITDTLETFHIQEKNTLQSGWKVQGNREDFRSKHGIGSGNFNIMKFHWFLFSDVQFQFSVSMLELLLCWVVMVLLSILIALK